MLANTCRTGRERLAHHLFGAGQSRQSQLPVSLARFTPAVTIRRQLAQQVQQPRIPVTLFEGHGIGPEVSAAVQAVFKAASAPIDFETVDIQPETGVDKKVQDSFNRNKVALKGPMTTQGLNVAIRKTFGLYANVRPAVSIAGLKNLYSSVDLRVVRETTEGAYSGIEHEVVPGVAQSMKIITKDASLRVASYAFDYASRNGRKFVTAVHKANIMKLSDGMFLQACREVASMYPEMKYEEVLVDNVVLSLVQNPSRFDVMVLPNLYGDVVSNLCAGLIGGLWLTPSGNIGNGVAVFEAVHGTAPNLAGKDLANPTALLFSGCMLLRHVGLLDHAKLIEQAVLDVIAEGNVITEDLGGTAKCSEFTDAICRRVSASV